MNAGIALVLFPVMVAITVSLKANYNNFQRCINLKYTILTVVYVRSQYDVPLQLVQVGLDGNSKIILFFCILDDFMAHLKWALNDDSTEH